MRKVGTLTSALTLLALGILLLLDQAFGKPVFSRILPFWPVVILGLGAELLWSLYCVKKQQLDEDIRVDARSIALLCLVGIFSIALYSQQTMLGMQGMVQTSLLNVRDALTDKTVELPDARFAAKDMQRLEVYSRTGAVKVSQSNSESILIKTKVHVRNANAQQANDEAKKGTPRVTQGATFRVDVDPSLEMSSKITGVDLEIFVPAKIALQVLSHNGNVSVKDHVGDVVVSTGSGDVNVSQIKGKATIADDNGQVTVNGVEGDLEIKTKAGSLEVDQVTGKAVLENTFGQIRASHIGGSLSIVCKNGRVQIDSVQGDVDARVENGPIQASHLKKAVTLNSGTGGITVESEVGGAWMLSSARGMVSIRVPEQSNLEFVGESSRGLVKGPTKSDSSPNGSKVTEKMGKGTFPVFVRTEDGAITLNANL
ncbi:DUF4097 family beta strand repeat-containing protein [Effusibacillus pohliae]|uniref:DUF4097 family beta strand repeat-containing protein n=1 Tax=Effusibacillus pohliae TaxID=232270 RepID=UPI0003638DA1|nr:DUF4097 family beta strand repeat-containing protein [Effusibacillus pohliae]